MIEYYTETRTPAELEQRARGWAANVAGLCAIWQYRVMRYIAERDGIPYHRVVAWVRWAQREGK